MLEKIHVPNEPPQIRSLMLPETLRILNNANDDIELDIKTFTENTELFVPTDLSRDSWYCTANAKIRVSRWGITHVKVIGTESINVSFHLYYKKKYICAVKTSCIKIKDEEKIVITNLSNALAFINLKICSQCEEHVEECKCSLDTVVEEPQGEYVCIPGLQNIGSLGNSVNSLEDVTGIFEGKGQEEVDFTKYEQLVLGISKTYKLKKKEYESMRQAAYAIVKQKPDISEEDLFLEIMKKFK
jgi:hypothetical protein